MKSKKKFLKDTQTTSVHNSSDTIVMVSEGRLKPELIVDFLNRYRFYICFILIFFIGCLFRFVLFPSHPAGLNQDEASIGYDAWCLAHYGTDRNGLPLPVHMPAWGSGQNALYAYLSAPFIRILGLNIFSVRIVNLLFGILSILISFFVGKELRSQKCGLFCMALVSIAPWHIMLSRWGLEANLFVGIFLLGFYFLLLSFRRPWFFTLAAFFLALSLYAYGSAYLVVPIFCILVSIYLLILKKLPFQVWIIGLVVFVAVALPIGLFLLNNLSETGQTYQILNVFTIPRLEYPRFSQETSGNTTLNIIKNLFNLVIAQNDGTIYNAIPGYGCIFPITIVFCFIGIIVVIKNFKQKTSDAILLISLFSSLLVFVSLKRININRANAIYMPLLLLGGLGLWFVFENLKDKDVRKIVFNGIISLYIILLVGFNIQYFGTEYRKDIANEFFDTFGSAIIKAEEMADSEEPIYVTNKINGPYISVLFFSPSSPEEYYTTVEISNPGEEFEQVTSFGRWYFNVDGLTQKEAGVYVVKNDEVNEIDLIDAEVVSFDLFSVVKIK